MLSLFIFIWYTITSWSHNIVHIFFFEFYWRYRLPTLPLWRKWPFATNKAWLFPLSHACLPFQPSLMRDKHRSATLLLDNFVCEVFMYLEKNTAWRHLPTGCLSCRRVQHPKPRVHRDRSQQKLLFQGLQRELCSHLSFSLSVDDNFRREHPPTPICWQKEAFTSLRDSEQRNPQVPN